MSEPLPSTFDSRVEADSDAHTRLIQQHLRRIFLLIYRIVDNVDDAQDLTQETFIKALQRQRQLKDLDKAGQWLSKIASNTAIDFLRRNKRHAVTSLTDSPAQMPAGMENPEELVLITEHRSELRTGLGMLTERERMALLLRDIEEMPAHEVALQMNCSMATVRSHIANARIKFKRYLRARKGL
ncbi:MAG: sigma-70 family RNA polymerase sigma factor [Acidobacteriaceae bacterium]|nr:sigma-70 family RNA polymerase sigma factor [Acidobacteriaceae bacterium]